LSREAGNNGLDIAQNGWGNAGLSLKNFIHKKGDDAEQGQPLAAHHPCLPTGRPA
jgi:hypothetical protein